MLNGQPWVEKLSKNSSVKARPPARNRRCHSLLGECGKPYLTTIVADQDAYSSMQLAALTGIYILTIVAIRQRHGYGAFAYTNLAGSSRQLLKFCYFSFRSDFGSVLGFGHFGVWIDTASFQCPILLKLSRLHEIYFAGETTSKLARQVRRTSARPLQALSHEEDLVPSCAF